MEKLSTLNRAAKLTDQEKILIVDDEQLLALAIQESLQVFDDYHVDIVHLAEDAIPRLQVSSYDLVISDVMLPGMTGLELLKKVKEVDPDIEVILMTAYATVEAAVEAMREKAFDYLPKPLPPINELRQMVRKALDKRKLSLEKGRLEKELDRQSKEVERLYNDAQTQAMKLSYINGISRAVNAMFDFSEITKAVLEQIHWIITCDNAFIILFENFHQETLYSSEINCIRQVSPQKQDIYTQIAKNLMKENRPVMVSGNFKNNDLQSYLSQIEANSFLGIPLGTKEQVLGVILIQSAQENLYNEDDLTNTLLLTNQVAIAIENTFLFQEITTEKGKIEAILSSTSDLIVGTDHKGIVTIVNPAAQNEFKVKQDDVYGKSIESAFNNSGLTELFRESGKKEVPLTGEVTISHTIDKKTFYTSISPVKGLTGETIGRVSVMQDISHLKELDRLKSQEIKRQKQEKQQVLQLFQSYVSPEVANEILSQPDELKLKGERRNITVLFADIRRFTTFAEKIPAEKVVAFLNDYFTQMTDIVFENKGTVDKFIGDCVMAIYGAPVSYEDDVERAIKTALEMREAFQGFKKYWEENGASIGIAIGINTGEVVVGNVGSAKKMDYTVIGHVVNFAARLEELAKDDEIIINESTYHAVQNSIDVSQIPPTKIRGAAGLSELYQLKGFKKKSLH